MGPSVKVQMYLAFFEGMIGNKNVFTLSFKNILTNHNIGYYTHTHTDTSQSLWKHNKNYLSHSSLCPAKEKQGKMPCLVMTVTHGFKLKKCT